ncbi:MAG: repressor LexA [Myxococcales bacterium]|nr:repressor LexA [Myxococcales bacterium]
MSETSPNERSESNVREISRARKKLTHRQEMILNYIRQSIETRGYPPTIREIGMFMGIRSTNGVNDHLKALEKKGVLTREELKSRALRPTDLENKYVEVAIVGKIAAGLPILAQENVEDTVRVDRFFLGNNTQVFALRVVGESMIGDGIYDGDYIFVRKQMRAEHGQIVVALIDEEATVKRYYPEADRVRFQPSNPTMDPIYVHKRDFRETSILGVVVGVYRKY